MVLNIGIYMEWWLSALAAYLVGSLNGAIIISKYFKLTDPRTKGSQNPGATNMLRVHGKVPAVIAFTIDFTKAILVLKLLPAEHISYTASGVCLGHIFPIYHKFKGGKGVAVTAGIIISISIKLAAIALIAWLLSFKITKISSVSAMIAIIVTSLSFFAPITSPEDYLALIIPAIAVIVSHRDNFKRLLNGSEIPPVS